jgi:hypothetical protein
VWTPDDGAVAAGHSVDPAGWRELFGELMFLVAGRFARVEPRRAARDMVLPPAEQARVVAGARARPANPRVHHGHLLAAQLLYLQLPGSPGVPWSGVVRLECSAELPPADVTGLADLTARLLPPLASTPHKDPRAPQNLVPIGGLERELRHRLGDQQLLYRALRVAATSVASGIS